MANINGRSYSSPSYGNKQNVLLGASGSLAGTAGATTVAIHTFMEPVRVLDWNIRYVAGGTDAGVVTLTIGKSLAGTGAVTAIGTLVLGTAATNTVTDASLTATNFSTGDDIVLQKAGTSAIVYNVQACVQYAETFEAGDN